MKKSTRQRRSIRLEKAKRRRALMRGIREARRIGLPAHRVVAWLDYEGAAYRSNGGWAADFDNRYDAEGLPNESYLLRRFDPSWSWDNGRHTNEYFSQQDRPSRIFIRQTERQKAAWQ